MSEEGRESEETTHTETVSLYLYVCACLCVRVCARVCLSVQVVKWSLPIKMKERKEGMRWKGRRRQTVKDKGNSVCQQAFHLMETI